MTDTSRFLVAGAARALWVRTKQGRLAEAMPELRRHLDAVENVIIESNSVMRFLRPDVYLVMLNFNNADFTESAREYLDLATAVVMHKTDGQPAWENISLRPIAGKPVFYIQPPEY